MSSSSLRLLTALLVIAAPCGARADLPDAIAAPGEIPVATMHAEGAQIYDCKADASGKLETFPDIYGHDGRLTLALSGKQTEFIDPVDIADTPAIARQARIKTKASKQDGPMGILSGLFGN